MGLRKGHQFSAEQRAKWSAIAKARGFGLKPGTKLNLSEAERERRREMMRGIGHGRAGHVKTPAQAAAGRATIGRAQAVQQAQWGAPLVWFRLGLYPHQLAAVNERARALGLTRADWLREAVEDKLREG